MIVAFQPVRYGSKCMAKSLALVMMSQRPGDKARRWHIACFGNRSHYHPETGTCCHVEDLTGRLTSWHRARARFLPFGDQEQEEARP